MKNILFMAGALLLFATIVYAETPKTKSLSAIKKENKVAKLIERSQGKIEALRKADESKGTFGALTVLEADGKKKDFELISKTRVFSANSRLINFSDLKKGDQVTVLYVVTLKGMNEAVSLTQTP